MDAAAKIVNSKTNLRPMLRLALPVVIEQLMIMMVTWTDHYLTAQYLETPHLAAINLMAYVLWVLPSIFAAIGVGATALVSRFFGAGEYEKAKFVTNQAITIALMLLTVITTVAWMYPRELIDIMQLPPAATDAGAQYFKIIIPVFPFAIMHMIGNACLRGAGDIMSGFITMAIVNVINVGCSLGLVTGWGPFPEMGWEGIAIGTAIGYAIGGSIIMAYLIRGRFHLKLHFSKMKPNLKMISRILKIGIPGGIDMLMVVSFQMWFLSIVNSMGNVAAAAHGTAIRIEALAYLPGHAFGMAATTMVGQFLGAGIPARASKSTWLACLWGGSVMTLAGLIFFFSADSITNIFAGEKTAEAVGLAAPLIRIVSVSMPSLAIVIIMTGALRGAGDTIFPLIFSFIGLLFIRIPLAYYLCWDQISIPFTDIVITGRNMGVEGAWYAMVADIVLRSFLILGRFQHGGWKHIQV